MSISLKKSNNWDFKPSDLKHKLANCKKIAIHCSVLASQAKCLNTEKLEQYSKLAFIDHEDWARSYMYATTSKSYLDRIGIKDIIIDDCSCNDSYGWVKLEFQTSSCGVTTFTERYRFQLEKDVDERGEAFYVLCIMHDKWYHGCGSNKWWY